jgi:hypothetical protein
MQVHSDWRKVYPTAKAIEEDIPGFKFSGPGFYYTKTDTILVLPRPPVNAPTLENVWHQRQPEGTVWDVYVYSCQVEGTIFAAIPGPTRMGER